MASGGQNLEVNLPDTVFPICDFLGIQLYSYPNRKTGKRVYHSIGFGKYGLDIQGRQVVFDDQTGKPKIKLPDFIYKLSIEELGFSAEKIPCLLKAIKMGNDYSWTPEQVVKEATNILFNERLNSELDTMANKENIEPTLNQLNARPITPEPWNQFDQGTGNSGFFNDQPWGAIGQSLLSNDMVTQTNDAWGPQSSSKGW